MKKLLALLLLAAPAFGASYTVTTTAAQETIITRERTYQNGLACAIVRLPASCTQAQADAVQNGAVTVYPTNDAFLKGWVLAVKFAEVKARQNAEDQATFPAWLSTATQAQKDAVCTSIGLVAGCLP